MIIFPALLSSLNLCDANRDLEYKEKYESLEQEFETYKQQMTLKLESLSANNNQSNQLNRTSLIESHKSKSDTTELNLAKTYSRNLEERIRSLNREAISKEKELKVKLEQQQALFEEERLKYERMLAQKDNEYRGKVAALEHQLLRQRERSLALVEEKDQEISTLKASFHTILTKKSPIGSSEVGRKLSVSDQTVEPSADYVTALLSVDSSPMLHYSQELARREKQVSGLRKKNSELETSVREIHREQLHAAEKHKDEVAVLQAKITRSVVNLIEKDSPTYLKTVKNGLNIQLNCILQIGSLQISRRSKSGVSEKRVRQFPNKHRFCKQATHVERNFHGASIHPRRNGQNPESQVTLKMQIGRKKVNL